MTARDPYIRHLGELAYKLNTIDSELDEMMATGTWTE